MESINLNLLLALDILLKEESVTRAAEHMDVSAAAMSRTLSKIREAVGDQILVRAGRQLVPTPRALELRSRVRELAEEARFLLGSKHELHLPSLSRIFTIRADDSLVATFGARLIDFVQKHAPNARIRFLTHGDDSISELREGAIDLKIAVVRENPPEIKIQMLFQDRFIGAIRPGHPLTRSKVTAKKFAAQLHVGASRRGIEWGPIDDLLKTQGLSRKVVLIVPSFYVAVATAAQSDLVASVPQYMTGPAVDLFGLHVFDIPLPIASVKLSQVWHPRFDADPAHQWLRECVRKTFKAA